MHFFSKVPVNETPPGFPTGAPMERAALLRAFLSISHIFLVIIGRSFFLIFVFSIRCVIQSLGARYTVKHNTAMYAYIEFYNDIPVIGAYIVVLCLTVYIAPSDR
jgi:hypothetical protein